MAYRYAVFLENVYSHIQQTMAVSKKLKFPVVLHPGNMLSNGMVAWAPRRMELVITPSPSLYAQNWDRQLVVHESRHVMQTSKLMQGIFKPLYYVIGEQVAGITSFGIPKWFFEGDAVATETALSNSGRGRLPEFNMIYRTQLFSGEFFSFEKWFLGSYKNYTGDYYALGYHLTSYARQAYGADIWDKVTTRYANRIYAIPPFSNALKHYTGSNSKDLFKQTFDYLHEEWKTGDNAETMNDKLEYVSGLSKFYTAYKYPQALNDSAVIALKSGLQDINSLVLLKNGSEKHLSYIGSINGRIALINNRIYWSEYVPGLRWEHENYAMVKYYDMETKRIVTLAPRRRYLTPVPDATGEKLAVSQISPEGESSIILLNADDGTEMQRYPVLLNVFVKDMAFGANGNIIAITVSDRGLSILQLDTQSGHWYGLMRPTSANITSPALIDGKLFFESGLNGINNIYYLDTLNLQTYRLTSARFGVFNPILSADRKRLVFSDYQKDGYRIASVPLDSLTAIPADFKQVYESSLAGIIKNQEKFNMDSMKLKPVKFEPHPYRRGLNLFKIHSWAPFYYDMAKTVNMSADDFSTIIKPGATILSQNTLNTAIAQAGWYYEDGYHHGKFTFIYMGWYPVIDLNVDYGGKTFDIKWEKDNDNQDVARGMFTNRNLVEAETRVYIPFNLSRNHYIQGFQPSVSYYYTNNRYQQYGNKKPRDFQHMLAELRYYHYRRLAQRDILPRWGYQIRLQYLNTPFDTENFGSLYVARLTTYLPGFIRNDGLMLRFGYQYQDVDGKYFYTPKRLLDKSRGYDYNVRTRQQLMFKADYSFNMFCPDFAIGSLAYIKRVRGNMFYDISRNQTNEKSGWTNQSSFGVDLIFDWNAFRLNYPLSLGIRLIKPVDYGNVQAEALFSIAFQ
jgi:hypothetical protein